MGAWIEIDTADLAYTVSTSHPVWVRGLKSVTLLQVLADMVAPRVGAWIEIIVT